MFEFLAPKALTRVESAEMSHEMTLSKIIADTVAKYAVDRNQMLRLLETVMSPEEIMTKMDREFHSYMAGTLVDTPEGRTRLKELRAEYPDIFTNKMLWDALRVTGCGRTGLTKERFAELEFGDWRPGPDNQKGTVLWSVIQGDLEILEFLVGELGFVWDNDMLHQEDDRRPENAQLLYVPRRTENMYACLDLLYARGPKNANS